MNELRDFDWTLAKAFLATVKTGSLSGAARLLGSSQPTLSRQVTAFADALGVTLFERAGRGLVLTEAGANIAAHLEPMAEAANAAARAAAGEAQAIDGHIRITASEVYAIHNAPGLAAGSIHTRGGPIMAAADVFHIHVTGRGGHAAEPHRSIDPVVAACGIVSGLQTIASRNHDTLGSLVLSVTQVHAGTADNVIPETAYINGTIRTFDKAVQEMAVRRLHEIATAQAESFGCTAEVKIAYGYPPTVNHDTQAAFAAQVAADVVGAEAVAEATPIMASEDFSYMLKARPGAYLMLGQGDSAGVHHPQYDFNDAVAPVGASFFARLVETAQPVDR